MNFKAKRAGAIIAVAVYATTVIAGLGFNMEIKKAYADTKKNEGLTYYYDGLFMNSRAERFYKTFETLENDGEFKKGELEYSLVDNKVIVEEDVKSYVNQGDATLPVSYGMGRDAYYMDNPDLFYADVFETSISAGSTGAGYVAYMDSSRSDTLYTGHLNTAEKINEAIDEYEKALSTAVAEAKKVSGEKAQIEFVSDYIGKITEYDFCSEVVDGETRLSPDADYITTAYGALVNGRAICGGYAKAYKAVLDRLNIPCVCVQGYSYKDGGGQMVPHMWNAVKLEGQWYGVDPTWNDTAGRKDWLLIGEIQMSKDHVEDGSVSSSGYELKYPALKPYNYGTDNDDNGMEIKGEYTDSADNTGKVTKVTVVYDGKGAMELQKAGKYLVARIGDKQKDGSIYWHEWCSFVSCADFMYSTSFKYTDTESCVYLHAGIQYVQFALVDYAPDKTDGATYPDKPNYYPDYYTPEMIAELVGKPCYFMYDGDNLTANHFISNPSAPFENDGFGSYIPAPSVKTKTPSNTSDLAVNKTYEMTFEYSDSLKLAEGKTDADVRMSVTSSRGSDTIADAVKIENFKWDGDKTITFTFTPSPMYIHNLASIYLCPTNLVGKNSGKVPEPVQYIFKGKSVVCSKIFNDGRLYMNVYGEPTMLDTTDLSMNGFKDDKGNYVAENQRSQLLLVANKPTPSQQDQLMDTLVNDPEVDIEKDDILTSATYEINLQICGVVQKVPNGSYMQVAFGFPEGFSAEDEGTTFKIYHYKNDGHGNITGVEEIPVIVTKYGLIAKVHSFSPFTIVAVKSDGSATEGEKNVYANVSGNGGTLTTADGKSGIQAVEGDSVTYTVKAEEGYQVDRILLNGKAVSADRYADGTLTLTKEELSAGNTLEASFVTKKSAESYASKGIQIIKPETIVVDFNNFTLSSDPLDKMSTGEIVGIVIASVALAAVAIGGVGLIVHFARKK